jgi:hypothetical protein
MHPNEQKPGQGGQQARRWWTTEARAAGPRWSAERTTEARAVRARRSAGTALKFSAYLNKDLPGLWPGIFHNKAIV